MSSWLTTLSNNRISVSYSIIEIVSLWLPKCSTLSEVLTYIFKYEL